MNNDQRAGLFWILLSATGYAFMPTLVKTVYANSTFEPMDVALWRFIFAVPMIWILVTARQRTKSAKQKERIPVLKVMLLGFIFAFAALTAFFGLERLPASTYVVLFYTYPAMVVILSFFLGEPIRRLAWIALVMALVGVALTVPDFSTEGAGDIIGVGFAIANAGVVALYYIVSKRVMSGLDDVFRGTAILMIGTLLTLCVLIPIRGMQIPQNPTTWLSMMAIAAFCTVMPVFGVNLGIQKIGASQASLVSTAEPVLSMVVAMILLGEVILPIQWGGAVLIISSVILLQLRPQKNKRVDIASEVS